MLNHLLSEKPSPDSQAESPLTQLHSVSLTPVTNHRSEEMGTCPPTSHHEGVEDSKEISLQTPLGCDLSNTAKHHAQLNSKPEESNMNIWKSVQNYAHAQ